jgi:hypothetical protein
MEILSFFTGEIEGVLIECFESFIACSKKTVNEFKIEIWETY